MVDYTFSLADPTYNIVDVEIRDFKNLSGDCGSRGTCQIPINRCGV